MLKALKYMIISKLYYSFSIDYRINSVDSIIKVLAYKYHNKIWLHVYKMQVYHLFDFSKFKNSIKR